MPDRDVHAAGPGGMSATAALERLAADGVIGKDVSPRRRRLSAAQGRAHCAPSLES